MFSFFRRSKSSKQPAEKAAAASRGTRGPYDPPRVAQANSARNSEERQKATPNSDAASVATPTPTSSTSIVQQQQQQQQQQSSSDGSVDAANTTIMRRNVTGGGGGTTTVTTTANPAVPISYASILKRSDSGGSAGSGGGGQQQTTADQIVLPAVSATVQSSPQNKPSKPQRQSPARQQHISEREPHQQQQQSYQRANTDLAMSMKSQTAGKTTANCSPQQQPKPTSRSVKPCSHAVVAATPRKNFINQESKFQNRISELTNQLAMRDSEANSLKQQIETLQKDIFSREAGMEKLQAELQSTQNESDALKARIRLLEEDLSSYKRKNLELADDLAKKNEEISSIDSDKTDIINKLKEEINRLNARIAELEATIQNLKKEKQDVDKKITELQTQKEAECKSLQESLDNAVRQKQQLQEQWEAAFEAMRSRNSAEHQQTLDDFEWKLREIELKCKRRIDEKERETEEKIKKASAEIEEKVKVAERQFNEVKHLKSYEAEVNQLRGLTHDQQYSLTLMSKQAEELQLREQTLNEEIERLKTAIEVEKNNLMVAKNRHSRDLADRERALLRRMEQQKTEIAMQWENRLRHECCRLKSELDQINGEERHTALETLRHEKDQEFQVAKQCWERKLRDCCKEIASLKKALAEKDEYYHSELENCHTKTDRDIIELRRTVDKMDLAFHNRIEKLIEDHEKEIDNLNAEAERKLKEVEANYQIQISSMRATVELVKEQLQRENEEKIRMLIEQHKKELARQWEALQLDKLNAIKQLEIESNEKYEMLEQRMAEMQKGKSYEELELLNVIENLKNEISVKSNVIEDLESNIETLQGGIQVLNQELACCGPEDRKPKTDSIKRIRELEEKIMIERKQHQQESAEHMAEITRLQKQSQAVIEQLQRKCQCLTKLFEEIRRRYDQRESRQEDLNAISDLRQVCAEQEHSIAVLNEEKRYFQMRLLEYERAAQNRMTLAEEDEEEEEEEADEEFDEANDEWNGDDDKEEGSINGDSAIGDIYSAKTKTASIST